MAISKIVNPTKSSAPSNEIEIKIFEIMDKIVVNAHPEKELK